MSERYTIRQTSTPSVSFFLKKGSFVMSQPLVAPELFRTPLDLPAIPYDHLLRLAAERVPERPAIIFHNLRLTYRQVVSMVNSVANGLRSAGIGKGDTICLFSP